MLCRVLLALVLFSLLKTSSLGIAVTAKTSNPVPAERHAGFFVPEKKKKKTELQMIRQYHFFSVFIQKNPNQDLKVTYALSYPF